MTNTKAFTVTAEFKINRTVWRTLGYGDQPAKGEVNDLLSLFVTGGLAVEGSNPSITLRYMGAPGHYRATVTFSVNQPWWRRAGFGDKTSMAEVEDHFNDFFNRVSSEYRVWASLAGV